MRDDEFDERVVALEYKMVEHDTRFSNGREVMGELREEIDKLKPKAPDWLKLATIALAFVTALLGGHYWIVDQLNDRPTDVQIEKIMGKHGETGHAATDKDIRDIQQVQVEQKVNLEVQGRILKEHTGKLDDILTRLPRRKRGEVVDGD